MKQLTTKRTICLLVQRTLEKDERIKSKCKIAHETSSQEMYVPQIFANGVDAALTIYICISICKYCRFCTWGILQRAFGGNGNLGFYTSIQLTATFRDTFLDILYLYFDKYQKNTHLSNCELHSTMNMSLLTFIYINIDLQIIAKILFPWLLLGFCCSSGDFSNRQEVLTSQAPHQYLWIIPTNSQGVVKTPEKSYNMVCIRLPLNKWQYTQGNRKRLK